MGRSCTDFCPDGTLCCGTCTANSATLNNVDTTGITAHVLGFDCVASQLAGEVVTFNSYKGAFLEQIRTCLQLGGATGNPINFQAVARVAGLACTGPNCCDGSNLPGNFGNTYLCRQGISCPQ